MHFNHNFVFLLFVIFRVLKEKFQHVTKFVISVYNLQQQIGKESQKLYWFVGTVATKVFGDKLFYPYISSWYNFLSADEENLVNNQQLLKLVISFFYVMLMFDLELLLLLWREIRWWSLFWVKLSRHIQNFLFVIVGDFFIIVIQSNLYLAVSCFPLIAVIFTSLKQLPLLTI